MNGLHEDTAALRAWLDAAWGRHDEAARTLAGELQARAATLPDDDLGAEAVRLARHTLLAHLGDAPALAALLAALPRGAALDPARETAQWALQRFEGRMAGAPLPDPAYGLLADVAQGWLLQGRLGEARALLFDAEAAAGAHADPAVRRAYAVGCNNLALALRTGPRGDAARDALMIDFARLSRRAWRHAGIWVHVERADYQLAMCHAAVGDGAAAVAHAQACLARCEAEGADAAERFFAHECNVHAQRAAGDTAWAAAHRQRMQALLAEIPDAGMKAWCERTLADTPA